MVLMRGFHREETTVKRICIIGIAGSIVALTIAFFVLWPRGDSQRNSQRGTERQAKIDPAPVRVSKAFIGELVGTVTASGTAEAWCEVEIKARVSAPVKTVYVTEGHAVKKGSALVALDNQEYRIELQEAKAKLSSARLEYALLKREQSELPTSGYSSTIDSLRSHYEDAKRTYDSGAMSIEDFLKAERQYQIYLILDGQAREELMAQRSGLALAEAAYARAEYRVTNCIITAPFDGIVGNLSVYRGDIVSASQVLMRVVDLSSVRLRLQVMEEDIGMIKEGETARAKSTAFPDTVFQGRIIGINPIIGDKTRSGTVICTVPNPARLLRSGMYVTAQIDVSRSRNRLLVPREAVIERDQRKLVFIVRNGKAFWCYVETGAENAEYIEIKSSEYRLLPGESVIVDGHFALAHDAPVAVMGEVE